jgi:hypothetical protein
MIALVVRFDRKFKSAIEKSGAAALYGFCPL